MYTYNYDGHVSVNDVVQTESGKVGRIVSVEANNAYAVVELFRSGVFGIDKVRINYYRKKITDEHIINNFGLRRGNFNTVSYNGYQWDADILYHKHGILIDSNTGEVLNVSAIKNNSNYYCDGYSVVDKRNIDCCECCGEPFVNSSKYKLIVIKDKENYKTETVCFSCLDYQICLGSKLETAWFDSSVEWLERIIRDNADTKSDSIYAKFTDIGYSRNIICRWMGATKAVFNRNNHSDKISECENCGEYYITGDYLPEKPDNIDDYYVNKYFGKPTYSPCRCKQCNNKTVERDVEGYYYKPTPIMVGEGRHYGVELEVDDGNVGLGCACVSEIQYEGIKPYYVKHDGSLGDNGMEVVSHPMTIEAHKQCVPELMDILKHFEFYNSYRCGLHVHTSRSDWADGVENNVYTLLRRFNNSILEASGREEEDSIEEWASVNYVSLSKDGEELEAIVDGTNDRYHALNIKNQYTFEIRIFASTLSVERYINCIEWVDKLFDYANNHTLQDCATALYSDVFGVEYDYMDGEETTIEVLRMSNKIKSWKFSNGMFLYVKRCDRIEGTFKHYRVVGYPSECHVRLPISRKIVGYSGGSGFIGISDNNVYEFDEEVPEAVMALHNQLVISQLSQLGGNE